MSSKIVSTRCVLFPICKYASFVPMSLMSPLKFRCFFNVMLLEHRESIGLSEFTLAFIFLKFTLISVCKLLSVANWQKLSCYDYTCAASFKNCWIEKLWSSVSLAAFTNCFLENTAVLFTPNSRFIVKPIITWTF